MAKTTSTTTSAAPKVNAAKAAKSMRGPQVRILAALAKSSKAMTRKQIAEKAPCDLAWCTEYVGSSDAEVRKSNDAKKFPSLVTLGFIKFAATEDGTDGTAYAITDKGRKELTKAKATEDAKAKAKKEDEAKAKTKAKAVAAK